MAKLDAAERKDIPSREFGLPGKRKSLAAGKMAQFEDERSA